ncbi:MULTISPECIES: DUF2147 domain-containing protein [Polaromonas]|uniref:DUF2147 domain-containing protein n=1 Tax=Polaromonas aquatica TaxID=332657 RepID=A0ABW1U2I4_9BURK
MKPFSPLASVKRALPAILLIAFGVPALAQGVAGPSGTPVGLWRSMDERTGQAKAEIRIKANGSGVLTGLIERALVPGQAPICTECTDDRKDKPKLGMEIIRGAHKADDKDVWEGGKILDPENGRVYSLRLSPVDGGTKLEVRASMGPFGRTQVWTRVQ